MVARMCGMAGRNAAICLWHESLMDLLTNSRNIRGVSRNSMKFACACFTCLVDSRHVHAAVRSAFSLSTGLLRYSTEMFLIASVVSPICCTSFDLCRSKKCGIPNTFCSSSALLPSEIILIASVLSP